MWINRINKISKFLLVLILITGWIFSGWPQIWNNPKFPPEIKEVKAAVPSGVIIAWPSTAGSIPSGWSRVIDLDTYFLQGTTTNPVSTVYGSATHTHTSPAHTHTASHTHTLPAFAAPSGQATVSGTTANSNGSRITHTHASGGASSAPSITNNNSASAVLGAASNDPPYTTVIWIQSDGTPTGIPNGAQVFFNSNTLPGSWTRQAGNKFLKGAIAAGDGGSTGGSSDAHTHTDSGHTHTEATHTHTGTTANSSTARAANLVAGGIAPAIHSHALTSTSVIATETSGVGVLANADGQPPFYKLNIIQNGTGSNDMPLNIIAAWTGTTASIPNGWVLCDGNNGSPNLNDKFIKGANADGELGTTGGAITHTHSAGAAHSHTINNHQHTFNTSAQSANVQTSGSTSNSNVTAHTHTGVANATSGGTTGTQTITADTNTTDTMPPYKGVAFIMYQTAPVVSVTLDQETFAYGSIAANTASSTLNLWGGAGITATNGAAIADFYVYGANSTGGGTGWTLAGNTTGNNYMHQFCNDTDYDCTSPPTNYTVLTTSPVLVKSTVAPSGTMVFQLQITTPTTPTDFSQQSSVVTIQASAP